MYNDTMKSNKQLLQNLNCHVWIVPESKIQQDDISDSHPWGYDDWEIYHGA